MCVIPYWIRKWNNIGNWSHERYDMLREFDDIVVIIYMYMYVYASDMVCIWKYNEKNEENIYIQVNGIENVLLNTLK